MEKNRDDFKYIADEFADVQVLRYRIPGWDTLSGKQKGFIYELSEAAKCGRDIFFDQNGKYNLRIRRLLEKILAANPVDKEDTESENLLVYAKNIFFNNGIYHHYSEDKIIPDCSKKYFREKAIEAGCGKEFDLLEKIIYDRNFYPQRRCTGSMSGKDIVMESGGNFYDGTITKEEAETFYREKESDNNGKPLSYGLNSRLEKKDGMLIENTYGKNGLYGKCIEQITKHLSAAADLTENELQRKYILKLIGYYESGSLESWDEYNIMWVGDTDSRIDFINGFIESYNDPLGRKGSWEGNVEIEDMEGTARTTKISAAAQEFEDASPVDPRFKKKKVSGISAKAINVACLGGDCYPSTPIGINLPNADWIRKAFGSKSVTIANITEAYYKSAEESPNSISSEFYYRDEDKRIVKEYGSVTGNVHTDLHECLGHGSGQLLPGVSANALGEYGSALEEARADLYALYFIADSKMVDMGILPNGEAYKAEYLKQIVNGLMIQFARVAPGKTNTEAHMQDRQLISQWSYEHGMNEGIIRKIKVNGKTFFEISDYGKLRSLFGLLLGEIQRIKSEGDYEAGKNLIEKYATEINPEIHREVIKRYSALGIKPYKGFINPCIIKVRNNDGSFDYKIKYEEDFIKQMLSYGSEYSFL